MQVKRRINQFFGNILRKDKGQQLENEEESIPSSPTKSKQKNKSNQSYSQWDLIEHIAGESIEDGSTTTRKNDLADNAVYSDGLAYYSAESSEDLNDAQLSMIDEESKKKSKSFLKRSGSLLRRSLRRSKKKAKKEDAGVALKWEGMQPENLSNIVQEINTTLLAVATFPTEETHRPTVSSSNTHISNSASDSCFEILTPSSTYSTGYQQAEHATGENESSSLENWLESDKWNPQEKKGGLKNGLKRQASKLASKFQRNSGSVRLKSTVSMDSFPTANRNRSVSVCTNAMVGGSAAPDLIDSQLQKRTGSFKRKLSFKAKEARKVVRKGVTSFGKSMMHASAVMPIAYETPPVTFYPDYEDEYPPHMVQCYYRTLSYQPKDCHSVNDKINHQTYHHYTTRPAAFYQHGYCYNG